jgi:sigma-B regulation protein RsbQ
VIAPVCVGQFVHERLRDSEFVLMKATGHCRNQSAPHETIDAIEYFLRLP